MANLSAVQVDVATTSGQIDAQLVTLTQKYLGNSEYVLSGTSTGYIGAQVTPLAPWTNLANRYYPTVATVPQSGANIQTIDQLGGYFTPKNLGVSTYLAQNLIPLVNTTNIVPGQTYIYTDPTKYNKGRGFTKKDQSDVITHIQSLSWLKASNTGTAFDGQVIGGDNYQKFIPYQSSYETTKIDSNGVISVNNDYEFWTGTQRNIWFVTNKFTDQDWLKYYDINNRVSNLLIDIGELYSWQTDVYGNQYALYKQVPAAGRSIYNMQNAYGQLWVKTVDNTIYNATSVLSAVYNKYINTPTIYSQLTANNIKNIDIFFDTLVIDLSGYTIYEKITFDYNASLIEPTDSSFLVLDYHQNVSTRLLSSLSLTGINVNSTASVYYGGNWYDQLNKTITSCLLLSAAVSSSVGPLSSCASQSLIVPVLYQYNINTPATRVRIFPTNDTDYNYFMYGLSATQIGTANANSDNELLTYIEPPLLTYNSDTASYVITFIGYVRQAFKIVNYNTKESVLLGRILVDQDYVPIVNDTGNYLQMV